MELYYFYFTKLEKCIKITLLLILDEEINLVVGEFNDFLNRIGLNEIWLEVLE